MLEWVQKYLWNQKLIGSVVLLVITILAVKLVTKTFKVLMKNEKLNQATLVILRRLVCVMLWIVGISMILMQFETFQKFAVSLLASSGVIAVILGFAAQEAVGNLVSGIFISIFRPFTIHDRIKIGSDGIDGIVEDISMRHTVIRTFTNSRIVVPNSIINKSVLENVNYSDTKVCNYLDIGISYDADLDSAMQTIRQAAENHPDCLDNRTEEEKLNQTPKVTVRLIDFAESAILLRAYVWSENAAQGFAMLCDLRYTLKKEFDRKGIEIPYPHRTVILKEEPAETPLP